MASFLLCLALLLCVLLNPVQELLSRSRQVDVLDTDVDALLYVAISHFLVDYDADSSAGDIVYDAGLPVVDFVGHAFLHGAVGFDVDDITNSVEVISSRCRFSKGLEFVLVWSEVCAHRNHTLLSELPGEGILRGFVNRRNAELGQSQGARTRSL